MTDITAPSQRDRVLRGLGLCLAGAYLVGVWLEGVGSSVPGAILPRTPLYFLQIAALFPHAAVNVIDYRAEGWLCTERRWAELDMRAYFPLDPDDKENRFQRVMHFFRESRPTMQALDEYVVSGHGSGALSRPDGLPSEAALGGIRVLSLRLPLPEPSAHLTRLERRPLAEYPKTVRKNFFYTRRSKLAERCGYHDPPPRAPKADDADGPGPRTPPADTDPSE